MSRRSSSWSRSNIARAAAYIGCLYRQILPRREKKPVDHDDYGLVFSEAFENLSMGRVLTVPNAKARLPVTESLLLAPLEDPG